MAVVNRSQKFRFKNTDETVNYFIEGVSQDVWTSKKHKKVWTILNHIEHLLILAEVTE